MATSVRKGCVVRTDKNRQRRHAERGGYMLAGGTAADVMVARCNQPGEGAEGPFSVPQSMQSSVMGMQEPSGQDFWPSGQGKSVAALQARVKSR